MNPQAVNPYGYMMTPWQQMQQMYQLQSTMMGKQREMLMKEDGIWVVKFFFINEAENRRVKIERGTEYKGLFKHIDFFLKPYFKIKKVRIDRIAYEDEEKHWINMSTQREWLDCIDITETFKKETIKIRVYTKKTSKKKQKAVPRTYAGVLQAKKEPSPDDIGRRKKMKLLKRFSTTLNLNQFEELEKNIKFGFRFWKLLYRGSRDGFKSKSFQDRCQQFKGTLVIIRSKKGCTFGGYNPSDWVPIDPGVSGFKDTPGAFLFGFEGKDGNIFRRFDYNLSGKGIKCYKFWSPRFGWDEKNGYDLTIWSNNSNTHKKSYSHLGGSYNDNGMSPFFLNGGDKHFQVEDIEVFCRSFV